MDQMPLDYKCSNENWLDNFNFSQSFILCVGSGPWRIERRKQVQSKALSILKNDDITDLTYNYDNLFPLDWQNMLITHAYMINRYIGFSFEEYCNMLCKNTHKIFSFYEIFGYTDKKHPKVLSMFIRDKFKQPAFPIDRHVKQNLNKYNIPHNEKLIIQNCEALNTNPSNLNRYIFNQKSSNPNY